MVINSTETTLNITNLSNVIQHKNIQHKVKAQSKIIQFPNLQILEQEVEKANLASLMNDKISADSTSKRYLHLLLVAGSYALARSRRMAVNS